MNDEDPHSTRFAPMLIPQKVSNSGICVEYSRENGFRAYQMQNAAPQSAKNDVWDAYLGVPLRHRELEVFQMRLAHFSLDERDNSKITSFLCEALLETWDDSLAIDEYRNLQDYPCDWEAYACNCCSDLDAWIRDREYELMWEDW